MRPNLARFGSALVSLLFLVMPICGDEKALVDQYNRVVGLFNQGKYAECRAAAEKFIAAAEKLKTGDAAYERAQQLLEAVRELPAKSYHNAYVTGHNKAQEASRKGDLAEAARQWEVAVENARELHKLKPEAGTTDTRLAEARAALERTKSLHALAEGKTPDAKALEKLELPKPKELSPFVPSFSLLQWDQPRLFSLADLPEQGVLVVHVGTIETASERLVVNVIRGLQKQHGERVRTLTYLLEVPKDRKKLGAFLNEHSSVSAVVVDDGGEFRQHVLPQSLSYPAYVIVTPDRRALLVSDSSAEAMAVALSRTVAEELSRDAADRPRGPSPYYPKAVPVDAVRIGGTTGLNPGKRPALVLFCDAGDRGAFVKALSDLAAKMSAKVDIVAFVHAPSAEAATKFAHGKGFATWWAKGAAPPVYGARDHDRLAVISARGNIVKVLPLFSNLDIGPALERYAELLTTPGALPKEVDALPRSNLAHRVAGGTVHVSSSKEEGTAESLIDGRMDAVTWRPADSDQRPIVRVSFLKDQHARFGRVILDNPAGVKDIEIFIPTGGERPVPLGRFRLEQRPGPQAFLLPLTNARSVVVELRSTYEGKSFGLGEVAVEEALDANPELPARLATVLGAGFSDEFAAGRLTFWEQTDFLAFGDPPAWVLRGGKLTQPQSPRGGDHRATALLHAATITGDFRLRATLGGSARAAGVIFGFRDWDNFDRVLVLEGQSQANGASEINSVRLERWREGRPRVLSVHGESAPRGQELRLEILGQGTRLAVTLQGQVIMNLDTGDSPLPGRAGLFTSDSHGMTFDQVRLDPIKPLVAVTELNPLSTAGGASIVWLSGQKRGSDDKGWAYHLLRNPVLSSGGTWEVVPINSKPPEIVLAFRDAAEVMLQEVGFTLPQLAGEAQRNATRRVEVLVSREGALDPSRFQSVGTFDLASRAGVQTFHLARPVPSRYIMLRLLSNQGGSAYTLAGVTARLGPAPADLSRGTIYREQVEKEFSTAADAVEKEPNDSTSQATPVPAKQTVEANIQPAEVDFYRIPDPPTGKGRATLRLQLAALPWMRLNAEVLNDTGTAIAPPLSAVSAGQVVQQTRPATPVPRFVKVQMPGSAISFVMDNSGSMGGREDDVRTAVQHFLDGVATTEEVEVLRFATDVVPLVPFTRDRSRLAAVPAKVQMSGNTALYPALIRAMTGLAGRTGSRAIVLLSDGMNTVAGPDFAEVCRRLRDQPVPVYVIGVGWDLFEYDAASGNTCHDLLRNLALVTGGRFFFAPSSDQLDALYHEIATELRGATRYRLRAEWEVFDRTPELVASSAPPSPGPHPASLPPAMAEIAEINPPTVVGPLSSGLPPLPAELADASSPPFVVAPGRLPNFITPELAELKVVTPPVHTSGAMPEFARLELRYEPRGGGTATDPGLPPAVRPSFLLILDSSGSMAQEVGGEKKFLAARRVMHDLVRSLPDDAIVGLRLFGISLFWKRGQEPQPDAGDRRYDTDSDLVVRVGPLDAARRQDIRKWIDWATPTGGTPLCFSLTQGLKDFPAERVGPRTVVLISDGMESQGGKLEDVARAYGGGEVGLVIHVVGFDVGKAEEQNQLKALARIGRGNYYNAADARQLAEALRQALRGARFAVHDEAGKKVVARGDINGDALDLPAGSYRLSIPGTTVSPLNVRLGGGAQLRIGLDDQGKMSPRRRE